MPRGKKTGPKPLLNSNEATLKRIKLYASWQCTQREAAAAFGVGTSTFKTFLREDEKARAAWDDGKELGTMSIKRAQFKTAEKGNPTMLVWLGKQHLGQRDRIDSEQTHNVSDKLADLIAGADGHRDISAYTGNYAGAYRRTKVAH